ncbi:MAG: hypothetical protein JXB42_05985 [Deltaproteobacteria bacterium]|nr:hypothetical protein [Deltaproteobacteria bacterium]
MAKREKIIVSLMILALLYGAYTFFIAPSSKNPKSISAGKAAEKVGADKMMVNLASVLKDDESASVDAYILARAEEEWTKDPFYIEKEITPSKDSEIPAEIIRKIELVYTGYLEVGGNKIAIINGADYQIGDKLEMSEYRVESISPSMVIVAYEEGEEKLTVPLSEE